MKTKVSLRFKFRKPKRFNGGLLDALTPGVLACDITVGGKSAQVSTYLKVLYGEWDANAQRVKGRTNAARTTNEQLIKMLDRLTDLAADLDRQGKPVTAKRLKNLYLKNGAVLSMLELFEAFIVERKTLINLEIGAQTVVQHKTRYNKLTEFLTTQKILDLRPEEFTHNLADKLLYWLLRELNYTRNSANNVLKTIKQVLTWAVRREHLDKSPLDLYQFKAEAAKKIEYLGVAELATISTAELAIPCLGRVRDCFVFQCWTGLAYADMAALNVAAAEYHRDEQGNVRRVLRITRAKSTMQKGYECVIPLLPEAERILALYSDKLPVPTNQVYNRYLKQVGELCGIAAEKMTSHVGRKTAGTLLLNQGVPLPVVSKFLGHANTIITQRLYAELLDTTVMDGLSALFGGLQRPSGYVMEVPPPRPIEVAQVVPVEPKRPARRIALPAAGSGRQRGGAAV